MISSRACFPRTILGVDFSGASSAGRKIWISEGRLETSGVCRVERCVRAADLPGGGRDRNRALSALVNHIASLPDAVVGLDFPFSLPAAHLDGECWESFVRQFSNRFRSADAFRAWCRARSGGKELKRQTDIDAKTPFSPYNIRLYFQTYHGLRDVLHPLVAGDRARILPMQEPAAGKPVVLEICPASTLKRHAMYLPYKGKGESARAARETILRWIIEDDGAGADVELTSRSIREGVLEDTEGDALDSLIALVATLQTVHASAFLPPPGQSGHWGREGFVYV